MKTELYEAAPFTSGSPDSILAGVWRQILKDMRIDDAILLERISMYVETLKEVPQKRRTQIRGNMRTDVYKENLTWYSFTKNLRILGATSIKMEFRCKHISRYSRHSLLVELNDNFVNKKDENDDGPSPMSAFLSEIMFNLQIDYTMFEMLLELFMRRSNMEYSPQTRNDLRAYFRKEFRSPKMSWKSLVKGLSFLCILEVDMHITLYYGTLHETKHRYKFKLGDIEDIIEDDRVDTGLSHTLTE